MSTILDALRKVEKDQQARTADARARLLSFPARPDFRPRHKQRTLLFVSAGVMLAGLAVGAGLMGWGSRFRSSEEEKGEEVASLPAEKRPTPPSTASVSPDIASVPPVAEVEDQSVPVPAPVLPSTPIPTPAAPEVLVTKDLPSLLPAPGEPPAPSLALERKQRSLPSGTPAVPPATLSSALQAAQDLWAKAPSDDTSAAPSSSLPSAVQAARDLLAQATRDLSAVSELPSTSLPAAPPEVRPVDVAPAPPVAPPVSSLSESHPAPANTSLSFLQWSPVPKQRMAFIKVSGGPLTLAHEGDTIGGFTVVEIRPDEVDLRSGEANFTLRMR